MGCGCGGSKAAQRAASQRAAKAESPARQDPRTYWNGPPAKTSKRARKDS